jgi:hypothetical protein
MQKQMPKIEVNNPWLKDLSDQGREQVEKELAKQQNALKRMIGRDMAQRTARRIIQRSQRRVNYIIADELVKHKAQIYMGKDNKHVVGTMSTSTKVD